MGDCLRAENDDKGAAAAYLRALAIDPYYSDARFPLAEILEDNKQYAEAREEYRAVYEMTPEYVLAEKAKKRAYEIKRKRH